MRYTLRCFRARPTPGDRPLANIAILQETALGRLDCPREGSIEPEWLSVVADYKSKNARTRVIREGFDLGIRYSVVPVAELRKLMQDAGIYPLFHRGPTIQ